MTKFRLRQDASVDANRYRNPETETEYIFRKTIGTEVAKEDVEYFEKKNAVEILVSTKKEEPKKKTTKKPKKILGKITKREAKK